MEQVREAVVPGGTLATVYLVLGQWWTEAQLVGYARQRLEVRHKKERR